MPRANRSRQSTTPPGGGIPPGQAGGASRGRTKPGARLRNGGTATTLPAPVGIQHFSLSRKDGKTIAVDPQQFILGYTEWLKTNGVCRNASEQLLAFNTGMSYVNSIGGMSVL